MSVSAKIQCAISCIFTLCRQVYKVPSYRSFFLTCQICTILKLATFWRGTFQFGPVNLDLAYRMVIVCQIGPSSGAKTSAGGVVHRILDHGTLFHSYLGSGTKTEIFSSGRLTINRPDSWPSKASILAISGFYSTNLGIKRCVTNRISNFLPKFSLDGSPCFASALYLTVTVLCFWPLWALLFVVVSRRRCVLPRARAHCRTR